MIIQLLGLAPAGYLAGKGDHMPHTYPLTLNRLLYLGLLAFLVNLGDKISLGCASL
jgi:hypothetical protein